MEEKNYFDEVFLLIEKLYCYETDTNEANLRNLESLGKMVSVQETRPEICEHLYQLDFDKLAIKILEHLRYKNLDKCFYKLCDLIFATSDQDSALCSKYIEAGMVEFFKECSISIAALPKLEELDCKTLQLCIAILGNISLSYTIKENCGGQVDWLFPMLKIKKEDIDITALILLSHLVDDNENKDLTDEEGIIGKIVEIFEQASLSSKHCHKRYNLVELLLAIGNLARNSFNREQLKQCKLLELLKTLLDEKEENIQELAMNIMLTMLLDNNILTSCTKKLQDDLKLTFQKLNLSENVYINSDSKSALALVN